MNAEINTLQNTISTMEKAKVGDSFQPVSLGNLPWGSPTPVDLFLYHGQEIYLLFREGENLSVDAYGEVAKQTNALYYKKNVKVDWQRLVDDNLSQILQAPFPVEAKTEIAYGSTVSITRQVFDEFTKEGYESAKETVEVLSDLINEPGAFDSFMQLTVHDYYTYTHSVHVYIYASLLTKVVVGDKDRSFSNELGLGYLLHDIGKKDISPEILNKPGPLDDEEWKIIKTHPQVGYDTMIEMSGEISKEVAEIVLQHHERCDASGYPNGLTEHEIGCYGKICAIADVFDALTTNRSYKKAMSRFDAMALMKESEGQFDKDMLHEFIQI